MSEWALRDAIVGWGRALSHRGLSPGSSGNISVRTENGWLMTPTGSSLATLESASISRLDGDGHHLAGDPPTKEARLHLAMYAERPDMEAIVHLHSTHAVAVACLEKVDPDNVLPPLTPYYVMRIGRLPLVPYHRPGHPALADAVRRHAQDSHALLLANHGPLVAGPSLETAAYAIEEIEETAKLVLLLGDRPVRHLTDEQKADISRQLRR
jgi:ribulose-5-phosphate 4-epimerase/fuculose-1-phosphate aldolase